MNLKNILWVRNTGEIIPNAPIADNLLGLKLSGGDIITTATGNPVSIVTNKAQNAISTILSYSPKQTGSGDPSPQNIRPIEGWTEANLGVNSETPTTTISLGGTYYGFTVDVERGVLMVTCVSVIFDGSVDENIFFVGTSSQTAPEDFARFSVEIPSDSITLTEGNKLTGALWSNMYVENTNNNTFNGAHGIHYRVNGTHQVVVADAKSVIGSTVEQFREFLGTKNLQVVYGLATPLELPLTPQTVALLAGANTLWTDGDSLSVTYMR